MVEILECRAETEKKERGIPHPRAESGFGKRSIAVVPVQRVGLQGEIRHVNIGGPIPVVVSEINSHARTGNAILAIGHARQQCLVRKRAVTVIPVQEVRRQIVCDKYIRPPVAIVVAAHDPESFSLRVGDTRLRGNIGKGPVAVVVIQQVGHALVDIRSAVGLDAVPGASPVGVEVEFDVHADVQVQVAVPVVVEEYRAGRKQGTARHRQPCLSSHVVKNPDALVTIEDVRSVIRNE